MSVTFVPEGKVDVPEIPLATSVELPAATTAVVVVDMQNDFVKPEGSLTVEAAQSIVPSIQELLAMARRSGVKIAYTQDTAVPEDPEFDIWPSHCVEGTWGWEIIEELQPRPENKIFKKNRYDAFYDSGLDHYLTRLWKIEHLVIVGTVSSICVLHTAASAGLRWFHVVVPANGIGALTTFGQALTLYQVSSLYRGHIVRSVADIHFAL